VTITIQSIVCVLITYLYAEGQAVKAQQSAPAGTRPTQSQSRRRGRKTADNNKTPALTIAANNQPHKYGSVHIILLESQAPSSNNART